MKSVSAFIPPLPPPHLLAVEQVEQLEKAKLMASFNRVRTQIPPKYRGKSFVNITDNGNITSIKKTLKTAALKRRSVYHHGDYGCGKTLLHSAVCEYCIVNQTPIKWSRTVDLLNDIRACYNTASPDDYEQLIRQYHHVANCGILFLDDIGVEKVTEWVEEKLYDLIDYVYTEEGCVWLTSNLGIGGLSERLGQRIADRIFEMCVVIENTAPNYRIR